MAVLPPPSSIIGISKFDRWYPNQDRVFSDVLSWLSSSQRFLGLSLPTGAGKSLLSVLSAHSSGRRAVILTATKGLQAQIGRDFSDLVVDIRGQNSFQCLLSDGEMIMADEGPCHQGFQCQYKASGCPYYDRLRKALRSQVVVTNYAYYLVQHRYSTGLGDISLLILDEAHLALSALESMLAVYVDKAEIESMGAYFPGKGYEDWDGWKGWALSQVDKVELIESQLKEQLKDMWNQGDRAPSAMLRAHRAASMVARKLREVVDSKGAWVWERRSHGWLLSPVWVTDYMPLLYRDIGKVMSMSAVLTPKLMEVLGTPVEENRAGYVEMPSYFPPENSPIIHIPTVRMSHRSSNEDLAMWVARIDQIIDRRLDRKGIIFTTSYARRDLVLQKSRHKGIMISHGTKDVVQAVNKFKQAKAPAVLVSPAVTSGWDFSMEESGQGKPQYSIIGKIPYPDTRVPAVRARMDRDNDWTSWMAMQTLVQEAGRINRSVSCKGEIFVVDDSWLWYWKRYKNFAPNWFRERVVGSSQIIPEPLF